MLAESRNGDMDRKEENEDKLELENELVLLEKTRCNKHEANLKARLEQERKMKKREMIFSNLQKKRSDIMSRISNKFIS